MKKFLAIIMVTFLLLTFSVTAFAEVESSAEEIVTEEVSVTEEASDPFDFTVDDVFNWVKANYDKISVVVTL